MPHIPKVLSARQTLLINAEMLPTMQGLRQLRAREESRCGGRGGEDRSRQDNGKRIPSTLSKCSWLFVLYADEVFDKTKTFPLKGLEEKPHCMLSTPQGCSFSTAWQNSAEKLEFL